MLHVQTELRASTLADVLDSIKQMLEKVGLNVPMQVGKNYLENFGTGTPPKMIFVPEAPGGSIADPFMAGNAASYVHSCDVYVRAQPGPTDIMRFAPLYELTDKVLGIIAIATTGKHEWGTVSDASPLTTDSAGCSVAFSFRYRRDVSPYEVAMFLQGFENTTKPVETSNKIGVTVEPTTLVSEE